MHSRAIPLLLLTFGGVVLAEDNNRDRFLFRFENDEAARQWQTVNDGVMGGRSDGRFQITKDNTLRFFGNLSLENNGGFASVRARPADLKLHNDDTLVARVRTDGREYSLNLYVPTPQVAFCYRAKFQPQRDQWTEIEFPIDQFVATSFGRAIPGESLDATKVNGLGFLLGDKEAGPFQLEVAWIQVRATATEPNSLPIECAGTYSHHLQGVCMDEESIYWCFTTSLVKTDRRGNVQKEVPVANHHGDLCFHDGKLYVAVNLGKFNDPNGNADSWVYVYDAATLAELARHEVQEVVHGAGGIGFRDGHFFVVGGLPNGVEENYVYEYDSKFQFVNKHVLPSGHTHLGIQTATFADGFWWFGCYGNPKILLKVDTSWKNVERFEFDCSLGIVPTGDGKFLVARGGTAKPNRHTGRLVLAEPDPEHGLKQTQSP